MVRHEGLVNLKEGMMRVPNKRGCIFAFQWNIFTPNWAIICILSFHRVGHGWPRALSIEFYIYSFYLFIFTQDSVYTLIYTLLHVVFMFLMTSRLEGTIPLLWNDFISSFHYAVENKRNDNLYWNRENCDISLLVV